MDIQSLVASRARALAPSPIRKLAPMMRRPGMISLGGGYPNPSTFAFERVDVSFRGGRSATLEGALLQAACQYGPTECDTSLRPLLRAWHEHKDGVQLGDGTLQVLNGSQEGLHVLAYLLLEPGDVVALSEPAYPGALGAFGAFSRSFVSFPIDENGTRTSELERILEAREARGEAKPKFVYEVPNGHNPGGVALSLDRRRDLLRIASRFDLLVVEDDPYQLVQLDTREPIPTLQALDTEGRVLRLDSFSKIFAPGLRVGYASGPPELIRLFELYKQTTNLHTGSMVQALLAQYLSAFGPEGFAARIRESCDVYRTNRDAMVDAARRHLDDDVRFNVPSEGMFVWFVLPEGFDAERMVDTDGTDLGVLLVPGPAFSTCGGLRNCMRASFSMVPPSAIEEGMVRFAEMVRRERARVR